ncbi:MAG: preprotein translocase subunit SecY, partial [Fimbriimonadaceae bacterium]
MALGGGVGPYGATSGSDKLLKLPLVDTLRLAWAEPELRMRIVFVLQMFAIFVLGNHLSVPIPGFSPGAVMDQLGNLPIFALLDTFGGGGLQRLSIFALGLAPYITASIIMQVLTATNPAWKKELREGGEYARKQQNRRTRYLTVALCFFQGFGLVNLMNSELVPRLGFFDMFVVSMFWVTGSMFVLWLGEQISEKGIGNGVSLMIFIGIISSLPGQIGLIGHLFTEGLVAAWQIIFLIVIFLAMTWFVVMFTIAQRRIPIQHSRRMMGNRMVMSSGPNYLPLPINMAGVIPIIFAVSLVFMPATFALMLQGTPMAGFFEELSAFLNPASGGWKGVIGTISYALLIFFFTYWYTAVQFNVEDIADNLKRSNSYIPGVRPGKQ